MTYIRKLLSKSYFVFIGALLACSVGGCSIGDEENGDRELLNDIAMMDNGLVGKAYKSAMLMGDIDAITSKAGKRDSVRHSNISTYITANTMRVGNFPCQEILRCLPGAAGEQTGVVNLEYTHEDMPLAFNLRTDHLRMDVTPAAWEFAVTMDGISRTVRAEFTVTDGKMTYEELIHWKYHFILRLQTISVDGEPVETYNSMQDEMKNVYVYNAWIMNYNVF